MIFWLFSLHSLLSRLFFISMTKSDICSLLWTAEWRLAKSPYSGVVRVVDVSVWIYWNFNSRTRTSTDLSSESSMDEFFIFNLLASSQEKRKKNFEMQLNPCYLDNVSCMNETLTDKIWVGNEISYEKYRRNKKNT